MTDTQRNFEEVVIGKRTLQLLHDNVPIDRIELDEDNARIRFRIKMMKNGHGTEEIIAAMPEVKKLQKDIKENGGLKERVILQKNGNGKFKTIEGNCRLVCLHSLNEKHPKDAAWKTVPAKILPEDVAQKEIAIMLADWHVRGKIRWDAHEKAGQVHRMHEELKMSEDEIATHLRASKSTIVSLLRAYKLMVRFWAVDDGAYAKEDQRKWSWFAEAYKKKDLREKIEKDTDFADEFCRWVGSGRLKEGAQVRDLPSILKHPKAFQKFKDVEPEDAYDDAMKIVNAAEPELGSDFFKLLAKTREACTDAAQVKELLRIRADKVAKQRLLDTYSALVDFMRLADVEPPEVE